MPSTSRSRIVFLLVAVIVVLGVVLLFQLGEGYDSTDGQLVQNPETTGTVDPLAGDAPLDPVVPPPPMLTRPESSVYSYLLWISYAYRVANSDVATHAFSPWEEVRVNSYVMRNLTEEQRAIDQLLVDLDTELISAEESTSTVRATESWRYRYIDVETGDYSSPAYEISYDTTYTLIYMEDRGGWLVHHVEATPLGEVQ